jgi:hypothetical protein
LVPEATAVEPTVIVVADAVTVQEDPSVQVCPFTVVLAFTSAEFGMFVNTLPAPVPDMVLFCSVSVVARPTNVSVALGRVQTPETAAEARPMTVYPEVAPPM